MPQSIKKAVQNALLKPRKKQYEKDYARLVKEYEEKAGAVNDYVSSKEVIEETAKRVKRLSIEELIGNLKEKTVYEESVFYLIYDASQGILRKESDRLIYEYTEDNPYAVIVYGDEDYFAYSGEIEGEEFYKVKRAFRYYKPIFSPETLASFDYIGAFAIEGGFLNEVLGIVEKLNASIYYSGMMYELIIEACARLMSQKQENLICHIPAVLVSREIKAESTENEDSIIADTGRLLYPEYQKIMPALSDEKYAPVRQKAKDRLKLIPITDDITVSIIIPSKDNPDMLISCIDRLKLAGLTRVEVIVVDNGSNEDNKKRIEEYLDKCEFETRYIYSVEEFNYSKMNNDGAGVARGEVLLLLNDDIEAEGHHLS